jgi:hypothetical protein
MVLKLSLPLLKHIDKAVLDTLGEVFAAIEAFGVGFEAAS